jgi:uncharacterized protein
MKKLLLTFIAFFLLAVPVFAAYPDYRGFVNDYTGTLTQEEQQKLETKLVEYDKQTTNQIAVAIVKTTEPETIEEYGIHLAEKWKPGQKGVDNGLIMIFSMDDHKMRNEIGRGLEGSITDIQSKHIQDQYIVPEFKNKNYYAGINKGIDQIIITLSPDSAIASVAAQAAHNDEAGAAALIVIVLIIIIVLVVLLIAASPYTPIGGQGTWGITNLYESSGGGFFSSGSSNSDSGSGFGGFGGGSFSGGGSSSSW